MATRFIASLLSLPLALAAAPVAEAVNVELGRADLGWVVIADNGPFDLNPAANVISYDSALPAVAPLGLVFGNEVRGRVATVWTPAFAWMRITRFEVIARAGFQTPLEARFTESFPGPFFPLTWWWDYMYGYFRKSGAGTTCADDRVTYQGYVNGQAIAPGVGAPANPSEFATVGGRNREYTSGRHGPRLIVGGPPWNVLFWLRVTHSCQNEMFRLPSSMHMQLGPTEGWIAEYGAPTVGSGDFAPSLLLQGAPEPGGAVTLDVEEGLGGAPMLLAMGLMPGSIPFGPEATLNIVPFQPLVVVPLSGVGPGQGHLTLPAILPANVPPGAELVLQAFIADPGTPTGISATNGIQLHIH